MICRSQLETVTASSELEISRLREDYEKKLREYEASYKSSLQRDESKQKQEAEDSRNLSSELRTLTRENKALEDDRQKLQDEFVALKCQSQQQVTREPHSPGRAIRTKPDRPCSVHAQVCEVVW